jgi:hypothetical protein
MSESRACVGCGHPVDVERGTCSEAGWWAHPTCVRYWCAYVDGDAPDYPTAANRAAS